MSHMLHHLSLGVGTIERSASFYDAVLLPLGYVRVWSDLRPSEPGQAVGYGPPGSGDKLALKQVQNPTAEIPGFHVAFSAPSRAAVRAFHAAALGAGARDNGPPGLRPDYGPHYYAAFVIDPDGHRLEAVCNAPEDTMPPMAQP
jgi:catechol 2,3-dioxygenase-like lactoylglutathione lyase family enzyme